MDALALLRSSLERTLDGAARPLERLPVGVLVHGHRERRARVPEQLARLHGVEPGTGEPGRIRVPKIVQPDALDASGLSGTLERDAEQVRVDRLTVAPIAHEIEVRPSATGSETTTLAGCDRRRRSPRNRLLCSADVRCLLFRKVKCDVRCLGRPNVSW
jgi:hypothetical protein